jgi:hypothetical protein
MGDAIKQPSPYYMKVVVQKLIMSSDNGILKYVVALLSENYKTYSLNCAM